MFGVRIGDTRWGKWIPWRLKSTTVGNLRDAIEYALVQLKVWRAGSVVYVRDRAGELEPVYQVKAGHDGSSFKAWKKSRVGDLWRRRVKG